MNKEEINEIINDFFKGKDYFDRKGAHIWIAKHGYKTVSRKALEALKNEYKEQEREIEFPHLSRIDEYDRAVGYIPEFETLTIEPNEGGQYEVAVRIWSEGEWRGYRINFEHELKSNYLVGINTRGH